MVESLDLSETNYEIINEYNIHAIGALGFLAYALDLHFFSKMIRKELIKEGINRLLSRTSADEESSTDESEDDNSE